ncbi:MAG: phosphodiester glycosidase family protein [Clostridia bacterium]|nr:phosphodiester glycosidase family protein [Clostridia bacterium]
MKRIAVWAVLLVCLVSLFSLGAAEDALLMEDVTETDTDTSLLSPLPMDFTPGYKASENYYTESGYEDSTLSVKIEKITREKAVYCVARVKIAHPSQLRTAVTAKGRTNKISTLARENNAVLAIGGEYFASDEGGYIVRMGQVQQGRKKPYETRDLLCIDENGDFHILLRKRDAKINGKTKSINPDFTAQLKALTEAHTLINVFDFGPALIIDGELLPTPDSYSFNLEAREPRCAIGQVGPLEYVVVVVDTITHHDRSGKEGATSAEVAQFLLEEGCVQAYNLDGGNSSLMVYHGENYSDKTFNEERSVSDIIYFSTGIDFGLELD